MLRTVSGCWLWIDVPCMHARPRTRSSASLSRQATVSTLKWSRRRRRSSGSDRCHVPARFPGQYDTASRPVPTSSGVCARRTQASLKGCVLEVTVGASGVARCVEAATILVGSRSRSLTRREPQMQVK